MEKKGKLANLTNAGKGKKPGTVNRTTKVLKEAILMAAELSGQDKKGKNGLVGYLVRMANTDMKAFAPLLGKVLPLQIAGDPDNPVKVVGRIERVIIDAKPAD